MCRCVSIIPGITRPPEASISNVPSGTSRPGPTASIRWPTTRTSVSARTDRPGSMGRTVPPRKTIGRPDSGAPALLDSVMVSSWCSVAPDGGRASVQRSQVDQGHDEPAPDGTSRPSARATLGGAGTPRGGDVPRRDDDPDFVEAV